MRTITYEVTDDQLQELRDHISSWRWHDINLDKLTDDVLFVIYKNYLDYQNEYAVDFWKDIEDPIMNDFYEDDELHEFLVKEGVILD